MRIDVLGVGFDNITMEQAVAEGLRLSKTEGAHMVVTPNPEIVELCREDPALRDLVNGADLVLADGIGILYGAKLLGTPLRQRLPGIEFAQALMAALAENGGKLFLLGAKPGVAEEAARRLCAAYPGLQIVGTHDGYFTDDGPIIEKINASSPDFLMVCLGSPKQERWMSANAGRLSCGLMAGL